MVVLNGKSKDITVEALKGSRQEDMKRNTRIFTANSQALLNLWGKKVYDPNMGRNDDSEGRPKYVAHCVLYQCIIVKT